MPWPVHPNGLLGAQGGDNDTYQVSRSLRFNSSDSAYLNRTPGSASNRKTWTWSGWAKVLSASAISRFFAARVDDSNRFVFNMSNSGLQVTEVISGASTSLILTNAIFRDISSWYHLVLAFDSTQATATNRLKLYVNGSEQTSFSTDNRSSISQNYDGYINNNIAHYIGTATTGVGNFTNCYLTEINFIDGQALTPSSLGETDAVTGRWKAKAYSGSYGTNGFYLKFADNSSTAALGTDSSGNGNTWTTNNFSVTAGAGNDSLVDSPTNYGSDTGVGGEVRGNYCTWNSLVPGDLASNGNLDVTNGTARGNQELMKYNSYWEVTSTGGTCLAGIISTAATSTVTVGSAKTFGFKLSQGGVFEYANVTDGSSFTSQATAVTPPIVFASTGASITASLNAGQRQFVATAPTGFKALCTTSLPTPTIKKPSSYFDTVTYTGTGASNSISSLGFSPDLVWIKNRGGATDHAVYDTTRGTQLQLSTNSTAAEVTSSTGLTAFGSNGFTVGTSSLVNTSGTQYVAWAWDEAPIAGMDIVSYTGNGANRTISHNLGVAPKMMIARNRDSSISQNWQVYHANLTSAAYRLRLNTNNSENLVPEIWNSTAPTSTVFSVGTSAAANENGKNFIAYLFAEVEGYSKFGSYTGNAAADGPFVYCGFLPSFILIKSSTEIDDWLIYDNKRNTFNVASTNLVPNTTAADATISGIDFVSNGFKLITITTTPNAAQTYIFAAFAESPFKYARAR
jgi:hypothetical protein